MNRRPFSPSRSRYHDEYPPQFNQQHNEGGYYPPENSYHNPYENPYPPRPQRSDYPPRQYDNRSSGYPDHYSNRSDRYSNPSEPYSRGSADNYQGRQGSRPKVFSTPNNFSPASENSAAIPAQIREKTESKPRPAKNKTIQDQIRAAQERMSGDKPNLKNDNMDMDRSSPEKSAIDPSYSLMDEYEKPYREEEHEFAPEFPSRDTGTNYSSARDSGHGLKSPQFGSKPHVLKKKSKKSDHMRDGLKKVKRKRKEHIQDLRAQAKKRRKHSRGWRLNPLEYVPGPNNDKRWEILDRIGRGRFSDVFSALDNRDGKIVAIKVDKEEVGRSREKDLLQKESEIMKQLGATPYSCAYIHFDYFSDQVIKGGGNYLVMELCKDTNISDWRKKQPGQCFGPKNGAALGKEMLKALKHFHEKGWLHRDIKPSNFIQPLHPMWDYHCYIVDFGLAKRWRDQNGKIVPQGETEDFVGTSLYASLAAHEKRYQSRADDLWSLMFMIIDCATNRLPWKDVYMHMEGRPTQERRTRMYELKKKFTANPGEFLEYKELIEFMKHLKTLKFESEPDYTKLLDLLQAMVDNPAYAREQAEIDNSTVMVVIPRYAGLSKDRKPLCPYFLQCDQCPDEGCELEHPERKTIYQQGMPLLLCYAGCVRKCKSVEPGECCGLGYHWTEQEEAHFRATGMVPAQSLNPVEMKDYEKRIEICLSFLENRTECKCDKFHPRQLLDPNCPYTHTRLPNDWSSDEEDYFRWYGVIPEVDDVDPGPTTERRCQLLHPILQKKWQHLATSNTCTVKFNDLSKLQLGDSTITAVEKSFEEFNQMLEENNEARYENMRLILDKHSQHWSRMFDAFEDKYNKRVRQAGDPSAAGRARNSQGGSTRLSEFPALLKHNIKHDKLDHSVAVALEEFVRHARAGKLKDPQSCLSKLKPKEAIKILAALQQDKDLAKYANLSKKLEQRVEKRLEEIKAERKRMQTLERERKRREEEQRKRRQRQEEQRREFLQRSRVVHQKEGDDFLRDIEKQVIGSKPKTSAEIVAENQKRLEKENPTVHAPKAKSAKPIIVNIESDTPKKASQTTKPQKKPKVSVSKVIPRKGRNQTSSVTSPKMMKAIEKLQKKRKINLENRKTTKRKIIQQESGDSESDDLDMNIAVVKKHLESRNAKTSSAQVRSPPRAPKSAPKPKPTPVKSPQASIVSPSGRASDRMHITFSDDDSSSDDESSEPIHVSKKKKQLLAPKKSTAPPKRKKRPSPAKEKLTPKKKAVVPPVMKGLELGGDDNEKDEEEITDKKLRMNEKDLERMLDEQSDDEESSIGEDTEFIKQFGLDRNSTVIAKPNLISKQQTDQENQTLANTRNSFDTDLQQIIDDTKIEEEAFRWMDANRRSEQKAEDIASRFNIGKSQAQRIINLYTGVEKPRKTMKQKKRMLERMDSDPARKKRKRESQKSTKRKLSEGSPKRELSEGSPKRKRMKVDHNAHEDCSTLPLPDLPEGKFNEGPTWDILYAKSISRVKDVGDIELNTQQDFCKKWYKKKRDLTDEEYDAHPLADYCAYCKLSGCIVFCQACPLGYHHGCTYLLETPAEDEAWYCHNCLESAKQFEEEGYKSFDKLPDEKKSVYLRKDFTSN